MNRSTSFDELMSELHSLANPSNVEGQRRFAICDGEQLGVSLPDLRRMARGVKDHDLALRLWASNVHEAKLLASMIDDPEQVTTAQMNAWVADFESWDICDQASDNLFIYTNDILELIPIWAADEREFVRRAAFTCIATLAWHSSGTPDETLAGFFPLIEKYSQDPRNFVRKAVSWALRNIGKRRAGLRDEATALALSLSQSNSATARWIGKDALKEFETKFGNPGNSA